MVVGCYVPSNIFDECRTYLIPCAIVKSVYFEINSLLLEMCYLQRGGMVGLAGHPIVTSL